MSGSTTPRLSTLRVYGARQAVPVSLAATPRTAAAASAGAAWQASGVADTLDSLVDSWLTFAQAGDLLGLSSSKIRQLAREHELVAVRRDDLREPAIPAACIADGVVVKGLAGTLVLLADHGFDDAESIEWLFTADDSLPGRPIDALREDRGKEVRRRAQAII
jgi:Rv2175c C-terminal domain of unknown function